MSNEADANKGLVRYDEHGMFEIGPTELEAITGGLPGQRVVALVKGLLNDGHGNKLCPPPLDGLCGLNIRC